MPICRGEHTAPVICKHCLHQWPFGLQSYHVIRKELGEKTASRLVSVKFLLRRQKLQLNAEARSFDWFLCKMFILYFQPTWFKAFYLCKDGTIWIREPLILASQTNVYKFDDPIVQRLQSMFNNYQLIHSMPRGFKMAISKHLPAENQEFLWHCAWRG